MVVHQSCQAISGLCKYLINKCNFRYVLIGKIQSGSIESRFGHLRQLSGLDYFISMRQLFENDRKLRAISLLKYSAISINDVEAAVKEKSKELVKNILHKAELLHADLMLNIFPNENDCAIIYYVSGYCCKSLIKSNKCVFCKEGIFTTIHEPNSKAIPSNVHDFFREISRGDLWKPTAEMFDLGCLCWMIFAEVSNNDLKKEFLSGHEQREVFMQLVYIVDNYLFQFATTGGVCSVAKVII